MDSLWRTPTLPNFSYYEILLKDCRFFSASMKTQYCDCYRLLQISILWKKLPLGLIACPVSSQPSEQAEGSFAQLNTWISSIVYLWTPIQGARVLWWIQDTFHIVQDVLLLPLACGWVMFMRNNSSLYCLGRKEPSCHPATVRHVIALREDSNMSGN